MGSIFWDLDLDDANAKFGVRRCDMGWMRSFIDDIVEMFNSSKMQQLCYS